jgi:Na+/melibiose symporter-like transporter
VTQRVPLGIKAFYSVGASGEAIKNAAFGFLLIFYNQVLGLSGTLTSLALAIALIADAVIDPAIGSWSDGMQTRFGRRHALMAGSIVPFCLLIFGLFWPPEGLSELGLFVWLTVFTVGTRAGLAVFHVPYLSLGAELTHDYRERTQIAAARTGVAILAGGIVTQVIWLWVFAGKPSDGSTGQLVRENYFTVAVLCALSIGLLCFASTLGTAPHIPRLAGSRQPARPFGMRQMYADIFEALGNRAFRALFLGTVIFFVYAGFQGAMGTHLYTFFWKLSAQAIGHIALASLAGAIVGLFFVPWFNGRFDKKWTVVIGVLVSGAFTTGPVVLHLAGWMPIDAAVLEATLAALGFLAALIGVQATVSVASMMGDIADEHELRHGRRQEGIYFGSYAFSQKCTTGLSTIVAGVAIDLIGLAPHADPASVTPEILANFGWAYALVALLLVFSTWVFLPYDLDRSRHDAIVAALRARADAEVQEAPFRHADAPAAPVLAEPTSAG